MTRIFSALIVMLMFTACVRPDKEDVEDGGYVYRDIFILSSSSLIPAHGYTYNCPVSGGEYELRIISYGIDQHIVEVAPNSGIVLSAKDGFPIADEDKYDTNPDNGFPRYLQTLKIDVSENTSGGIREAKYKLISEKNLIFAAEITIRQAGK